MSDLNIFEQSREDFIVEKILLRDWQEQFIKQAEESYLEQNIFALMACTGAGKTLASIMLAARMYQEEKIDRIIAVPPKNRIVEQWQKEFLRITGKNLGKITRWNKLDDIDINFCITWQALNGLNEAIQSMCKNQRVLVILDEVHHAGVERSWGKSANSAFCDAAYILLLTATPFRSDGSSVAWFEYENGQLNLPLKATYRLTYGEGVERGYCRPVTAHLHYGKFEVELDKGISVTVSSDACTEIPDAYLAFPGIAEQLSFYRLAKTPVYDALGEPDLNGYQASMLDYAIHKLNFVRARMPNAGGIIFAPSIDMAHYFSKLVLLLDGEPATIVHSGIKNTSELIDNFDKSNDRWIISVDMLGEGVDISRLRVAVYLPNSLTELSFRQYFGRIVRNYLDNDDTRGYVVMPYCAPFIEFARRIEEEMPAIYRETSIFDVCHNDEASSTHLQRTFECEHCGAYNSTRAHYCHECGEPFEMTERFYINLESAVRDGVISRGLDISESEAREAENLAPALRELLYSSGDETLCQMIRQCPDELMLRLYQAL